MLCHELVRPACPSPLTQATDGNMLCVERRHIRFPVDCASPSTYNGRCQNSCVDSDTFPASESGSHVESGVSGPFTRKAQTCLARSRTNTCARGTLIIDVKAEDHSVGKHRSDPQSREYSMRGISGCCCTIYRLWRVRGALKMSSLSIASRIVKMALFRLQRCCECSEKPHLRYAASHLIPRFWYCPVDYSDCASVSCIR
jgi:hypothetical protein